LKAMPKIKIKEIHPPLLFPYFCLIFILNSLFEKPTIEGKSGWFFQNTKEQLGFF